jgi:DNA-binding LacI/PurR family transcriptional regulator
LTPTSNEISPQASVVDRIAREVGVSAITVTRALNTDSTYRRPTFAKRAERIRELAQKHGYRINSAAQAMSIGRFNAVGLLHSAEPNRSHINVPLLAGIHSALTSMDLHLNSAMLPDSQLSQGFAMPKLLRELAADGLLIDYLSSIPEPMREAISRHRIPSIWINTKLAADCVYPDDIAAGRIATEHLLAQGHRRISFVACTNSNHYSLIDRIAGYQSAMREADLAPDVVRPSPMPERHGRFEVCRNWLERAELSEAMVVYGGNTCLPLVSAAMSLGIRMPDDLPVVTIERDIETSLGFALPTVVIPFEQVGRRAVEELQKKNQSPDASRPAVSISPEGVFS